MNRRASLNAALTLLCAAAPSGAAVSDEQFDAAARAVAHTGVAGVLGGGRPGPVIALRGHFSNRGQWPADTRFVAVCRRGPDHRGIADHHRHADRGESRDRYQPLAAVVSVGAIKGGIRMNIIPDSVEMLGTIRTFDPAVRNEVIARMRSVAEHVAAANGASGTPEILPGSTLVVVNDPDLTRRVLPLLARVVGRGNVVEIPCVTAAEAPANHSPLYFVDESSLDVGLRALVTVADYLAQAPH